MSNGQHYDWMKLIRAVGGRVDSQLRRHRAHHRSEAQGPDPAREPFQCAACGDRFPVADLCPRCGIAPMDVRSGRVVLRSVRRPAHGIALAAGGREAVVDLLHDVRAGWERRPGPRGSGRVVVRGTASVLRAVPAPDGSACGAFLRRGEALEPCDRHPDCGRQALVVRAESAVGLIAVRGATRTVIVGVPGSVQEVWRRRRGDGRERVLRDGQEVVVVGTLERRAIDLGQQSGYRDGAAEPPLCAVGTVSAPCLVLI